MADFSWAYVDCDNTAVTSFTSPTGSVIFSAGHKALTGSQRMMWDTGTGDADTHVLRITGTLDVSGTIRSYKLETITYENTNYLGSNTFGNSSGDTHKFTGEISGSGPLNIVGASTLESTLHVTGAITTAAGITASAGVTASYGHYNNVGINDGGTKSIRLNGDGTIVIAGGAADTTCLSASGDVNVVGKTYIENTLNVTGAITTAAGVTASVGVSSSYGFYNNLSVNQGGTKSIQLQSNGQIVVAGGGKLVLAGGIAGQTTLSSSGDANIVGHAYIENTLNVSGAISTALGVSSSTGISASYAHVNNLGVNDGGTKSIRLNGDGTLVIAGGAADTTCLSASGDINVVGKGFFENTLNVTGAISTASGLTASVGVSSSYGLLNRLQINGGGTRQIKLKGNGILTIEGSAADRTCLSASGDVNIVGKLYLENTLNVTGAAVFASTISGASGVTGSSFQVNDTIHLNANGNITNVHHIYPAADNAYDLGSPDFRWRNIYTGDLHLKNDRGDWTVIEESDYLSLTNNKTGHRYKILMERID